MRKFCDCVFSLWTLRYVFEWEQLDCYLLHESPNSISIWTFTRPWLDLRLKREKSESVAILIILPAGYCNIRLVIISLEGYNNIKMFSVFFRRDITIFLEYWIELIILPVLLARYCNIKLVIMLSWPGRLQYLRDIKLVKN